MSKVYLVWLHDSVLGVHSSYEGAERTVARTQGQLGGVWERSINRWHQSECRSGAMQLVSRLEIECREVES